MSPDEGGGEVAGSQPMSTAVHIKEAKLNFGDLIPYLTYGKTVYVVFKDLFRSLLYRGGRGGQRNASSPLSSLLYFPNDPWIFHLKTT
jgi:hypothetical protein